MKHYLKYYGFFTLIFLGFAAIVGTYGGKALRFLFIVALLTLLFMSKTNAQDKIKTPDPAKPTEISKPVQPAKPTFEQSLKAEDAFPFKMSGSLTYQQVQDYLFFESVGEARIAQATDVSARDYTRMKNNHQLVTDSLKAKFSHQALTYITDRLKKFTADTTAQYHPKK